MRFIQFWILPSKKRLASSVQQRQYTLEDRTDRWLQIMGPAGEDGLDLSQDARVRVTHLSPDVTVSHDVDDGRAGYLYVIEGAVMLDDDKLTAGDAVKVEAGPELLRLTATDPSDLILVDVTRAFEPIGGGAR
jgi:quercetin 2,3-dioxygenase